MPSKIRPISKQQYLVTIKGLPNFFETFSGINEATQTSDYSDGLSNKLFSLQGPRKLEDVTLTKAYDPVADKPILDYFKNYNSGADTNGTTISVTPVNYAPQPVKISGASSILLHGCRPVSLKFSEADKKSNDVSTLEIVFSVEEWSQV